MILWRSARLVALAACLSLPAVAGVPDEAALDALVPKALTAFDVPGMAIAVVKDGEIQLMKGYGLRDVAAGLPVDSRTYFRLGSTTKAFTTAALSLLVSEGKLGWNDRLVTHLPAFRLHDPAVTDMFTVKDMLTHRSGLPASAGDFMLWPMPSGFSRAEVIANLHRFAPVAPFRAKYAYNNAFYVVAGELVAALSGMPYEDFVEARLMKPLGIDCYAGEVPKAALADAAEPYVPYQGKPLRVDRNRLGTGTLVMAAAGGVACNAEGMARWMTALLDGGAGVIAPERVAEMWAGVTPMPVSARDKERDGTSARSYALGWRVADVKGHQTVSHTGALLGTQSQVMLVPEIGLGITLLSNGTNSGPQSAVMQALLMQYLAPEEADRDWIAAFARKPFTPPPMPETMPLAAPEEAYIGTYADEWYGSVMISRREDGSLGFEMARMAAFKGKMRPIAADETLIKWDDPTADADFIAKFDMVGDKITGFRLIYTAGSKGSVTDLDAMYFHRLD
ncbi:serine hydrolase [Gimibacter soli]|uniref:Serine hydrolase n=1 Tax=Gimibacter soli TaxID=3024400 RepID=A0AAE9XS51_9PROT|nr:serine hydrolase [Gimibacter soli]WCL55327.1 serine hydrolase [Gimibacter soli]